MKRLTVALIGALIGAAYMQEQFSEIFAVAATRVLAERLHSHTQI